MIKMILASTVDGGIGLDNKLPFHCPEDLRYLKDQTEGSVVVMGRKTFDSLPFKNGLPNRYNIVISSIEYREGEDYQFSDLETVVGSFYGEGYKEDIVWVIGGKTIYEQLLPHIQELHHTTIKGGYECDTFIDTSMWEDQDDWKLKEVKTLSEIAEVKIWRRN